MIVIQKYYPSIIKSVARAETGYEMPDWEAMTILRRADHWKHALYIARLTAAWVEK